MRDHYFFARCPSSIKLVHFFLSTTPVPQHFPGTKASCLLDIAKISSKTVCTQAAKIWKCSHLSWILKIKIKKPEDFSKWMRKVGYLAKSIYHQIVFQFGLSCESDCEFLPYRQLTLEISWPILWVSSFQWWQWPDYCNAKIETIAEYFSLVNEHSNIHHFFLKDRPLYTLLNSLHLQACIYII